MIFIKKNIIIILIIIFIIQSFNTYITFAPITDIVYAIDRIDEEQKQISTMKYNTVEQPKYTDEELYLLSHIIFAEAGSNWITDEHQLAVGSVVLNRVNDNRFPNTLKEVVYQKGQYSCLKDGNFYKEPNERAINNAIYLLENGSTIPPNIVWQSAEKQGKGTWRKIQSHYFCY